MFSDITNKIRLLFRKDRESYLCFYRILGFYPKNIELYKQALLHKSSSVRAQGGQVINNERLEFLGDAILDAIVADIVYKHFEGKREGFLTNTRSKIVQRETLNRIAMEIGLDKLVKYTVRQSAHNCYLGGNAFEALIGAIYLDRGYRVCKRFMEQRIIANYLNLEKVSRKEVNFKSKLIEWSQKNKFAVKFNLLDQSVDEEQNPVFSTQISVEDIPGGYGKGYSKKESQQEAAHETLKKIKSDPLFIDAIFAAKAEREKAEKEKAEKILPHPDVPENDIPAETPPDMPEKAVQEDSLFTEKYDDKEHIIAEAEEAAFMEMETKQN